MEDVLPWVAKEIGKDREDCRWVYPLWEAFRMINEVRPVGTSVKEEQPQPNDGSYSGRSGELGTISPDMPNPNDYQAAIITNYNSFLLSLIIHC